MNTTTSELVCAWCPQDKIEAAKTEGEKISHGICERCRKQHFPRFEDLEDGAAFEWSTPIKIYGAVFAVGPWIKGETTRTSQGTSGTFGWARTFQPFPVSEDLARYPVKRWEAEKEEAL